jgi:hypothetical protein
MASIPRVLSLLLVAGAGVCAFYVAAQLSRSSRDADRGIVEAVVQAAPRPASAPDVVVAQGAASAADSELAIMPSDRSRSIPKSDSELFAPSSWLPPPPAPVPPPAPPVAPPPPLPPPAPVAPPLPFVFVGMLERGATKPSAFIAKGDALFVVSVGDTVDSSYRIDSMTPDGIVMTYLPLNTKQTLNANTGAK